MSQGKVSSKHDPATFALRLHQLREGLVVTERPTPLVMVRKQEALRARNAPGLSATHLGIAGGRGASSECA